MTQRGASKRPRWNRYRVLSIGATRKRRASNDPAALSATAPAAVATDESASAGPATVAAVANDESATAGPDSESGAAGGGPGDRAAAGKASTRLTRTAGRQRPRRLGGNAWESNPPRTL